MHRSSARARSSVVASVVSVVFVACGPSTAPDLPGADAGTLPGADPRCAPSPYTGHACHADDVGARCAGTTSCSCGTSLETLPTRCECREGPLGRAYYCEDDCTALCAARADGGVVREPDGSTPRCTIERNGLGVAIGLSGTGCLPRCSADTEAAVSACTSADCVVSALDADTTPSVPADGQSVGCNECISYTVSGCHFAACPDESAAYYGCLGRGAAEDCVAEESALGSCLGRLTSVPPECADDNPCFP